MSSLVSPLLDLAGLPVYLVVGLLVFGEAAVFVGFVLPGETAVVLGGVLASRGRVDLGVLLLVAILAAVTGDSVGYEVGRRFGPRVLASRALRSRAAAVSKAQQFLRVRGGRAVFLGRFTAFLRAVMPGLAGTAQMPYGRFLAFNAAGGVVWAGGFTLLGYLAGESYAKVERVAGQASVAVLVIVVVLLLFLHQRARRRQRQGSRVT